MACSPFASRMVPSGTNQMAMAAAWMKNKIINSAYSALRSVVSTRKENRLQRKISTKTKSHRISPAAFCVSNRKSIRGLRAFDGAFFHPRHQAAQAFAHFFDGMVRAFFHQRVVFFVAAFVFGHPAFGEFAGLNIFQRGLHPSLHAGVNDFWPDGNVAPLGGFGN